MQARTGTSLSLSVLPVSQSPSGGVVVNRNHPPTVRGTPGTSRPDGNRRFPFVEMSMNSGPLEFECLVFDQVSWSNTPMFHNTLMVSSSPTSSTTQSPETEELLLCRKPLLAGLSYSRSSG